MAAQATPTERWELYRLLAEPARLRLLALTSEDELAVSELADLLGESQPNVSRHAGPLRQAGLLTVRRQGTWTLMRLADGSDRDAVIADAVRTGRALCEREGTLARVPALVRARDRATREFFARTRQRVARPEPPSESSAYLLALAPLVAARALAVDVGTGEGHSLEVLSPLFEHVIALDRSAAQLALCRERLVGRGFENVTLLEGELDGPEIRAAVARYGGADVVLAARVLHHAPRPGAALAHVAKLARPGGSVVVVDYERHEDDVLREQQADLWLGFERDELVRFARTAELEVCSIERVPPAWCGSGPDRNVPWQVMLARRARGAVEAQKTEGQSVRTKNRTGE